MKKIASLVVLSFIFACSSSEFSGEDSVAEKSPHPDAKLIATAGAPLFGGMGDYHRDITTDSEGAQRYFDQGMVLAFGFNHAESIRSFRAAQKLDPDCAMCFWGEALATGPNINVTSKGRAIMSDDERHRAFAAINRADSLKTGTSSSEQALISALQTRYNGDPSTERFMLDMAYAAAMGEVVKAFPDDDDVVAIFAESLMNTMPWDYWSDNGEPKAETVQVIDALEKILARSPSHPLALHLYIHATEASANPGRAEDEADVLANLVPGSGHLVHMPAHIYWRVGRYQDAAAANVLAAGVDEEYIAACNAQGFYPALYYPHNIHFLWAASSMAGQSKVAIESAYKVAANVHLEQIEQFPTIEFFKTIPILALTQFGKWDDILASPEPAKTLDFSHAIWHYARGLAYANKGNLLAARSEQAQLAAKKDSVQIEFLDGADYPASVLLGIADDLLLGEIAKVENKTDSAVRYFEKAVASQDALPYTEPPFWYYPTRQSLGAALLLADRPAEAEAVYRKDLVDYPRNGWSLFGLAEALSAQDKTEEAAAARLKFKQAWSMADVELDGSRL